MRKSIKLLGLMIALLAVTALQSCSKHDKGDVLDYVPADASVIVYGDFNYLLEKAGISEEGKIGEPLKSTLDQNNVDLSEHKKELALAKNFTREGVLFLQGQKIWIVLGMNDTKEFINYLEKEEDFDVSTEDGVKILSRKGSDMMIKDDNLFLCVNPRSGKPTENVSGVNDLCKLGDEAFSKAENTEALATGIIEKDNTMFAIANIGKLSGLINDSEFNNFKAGLSMVYNNPTYIASELNLTDDGLTASLKVLDSKYAPAKCSLPLGQIDEKAFTYAAVPGNTAAVALAVPEALINQAATALSSLVPAEIITTLKCINGTIAATFNLSADKPQDMFAVMVTANNNSDAINLGNVIQLMGNVKCSTSEKYLRVTYPQGPAPSGNTSYASVLSGKPAGMIIDLSATAKSFGLSGDYSQLGTFAIFADNADGSLSFKAEWKCNDPVQRIFDLANNAEAIMNTMNAFEDKFDAPSSAYIDVPLDSTAVYQEAAAADYYDYDIY